VAQLWRSVWQPPRFVIPASRITRLTSLCTPSADAQISGSLILSDLCAPLMPGVRRQLSEPHGP